jgi:uncharacterized repeat protein (TIGR01451 family)
MKTPKSLNLSVAIFALLSLICSALAAAPLANTPIGNQAKATYTDDSGVEREVFSNTVITRVAAVYGLTLVDDNTKLGSAGSVVYFQHTLTNEGNAPDSFVLDVDNDGGVFDLTGLVIYPDSNQDGLPDNFTPITSTSQIAPGGQFHFVVAGTIPVSASAGENALVTVTATSQEDGTQEETNTDTVTVTAAAVMQVTKAIDTPSGVPGTQATYTITYTNTGSSPAAPFTITDVIPDGMEYVAGSALWSVSGGTALDDDGLVNPANMDFDFGVTAADTVTFEIASVNPGQSGFVRFTVEVEAGRAPGIIPNTAVFEYTSDGDDEGPFNSNTVPFTVIQVPGVTLTPPPSVPNWPAGSTVSWTNTLVNTGTGTDTFDITIVSNNFPTGTTFQLFQPDGQTPMTDSNGNGTPDTGPVAAGATYLVVIKANLPSNASGDNGGLGFGVTKRATSGFDPGTSDEALDELDEISGAGVDITADAALGDGGALGEGAGPEGAPVVTNSTNPGTTTIFDLYVTNTGPNTDSYNLLADQDFNFGSVNDLPAGWSVVFRNTGGSVITNTGPIAPGANRHITAHVSVPAGQQPGDVSIFFQSLSPTSGAGDILHAAVDVNVVRALSLQTDNIGQTFPGGSVVYEHILTNNGNVTEGVAADSDVIFNLVSGPDATGWTTTLHYDANGDGILNAGELPIDFTNTNLGGIPTLAGGIAPGQSLRFFVRVIAPLGAADGATLATEISVTTVNVGGGDFDAGGQYVSAAPAVVSNTDTTNVVRGDLTVVKEQAISLNNDATLDTPFTTQLIPAAPPGSAIVYRIRVTNVGSADATAITVNDTVPAHTTYNTDFEAATITIGSVDTEPANGAAAGSSILFNVGTLTPTQVSEMTFRVVIDQ